MVGGPNHIGGPTWTVKGFVSKLGKLPLEGKQYAVFDTHLGKDFEKAVKKTEDKISNEAPKLKRIAPGLSIRVEGMKGPVSEGELTKCVDFGKKIASQLET